MILRAASLLYGAAVTWRRHWYTEHPRRRYRLRQPVISVGNLSVGGSGKTPIVAQLARLLAEQGERPAILSLGYGRRTAKEDVTVVSDGRTVLGDLDVSGDEPLMLARTLPGVPVLVGSNRYRSGTVAEEQFAATVHVLDDGFQHLKLERDVDLLAVSEEDLKDELLPAGRLREPLTMAADADAALVTAGYDEAAARVGRALGLPMVFRVVRAIGAPRLIETGETVVVPSDEPVFAVAAIARPERFSADLASAGWRVAGVMTFRDHHRFTDREIERVLAAARAARATIVMTTEKDAVRLSGRNLGGAPVASVPLTIRIEPEEAFANWLRERLQAARLRRSAPGTPHPAPLGTLPPSPGTSHRTSHLALRPSHR